MKNAKVDVRELKTEIKKNKEFNSKITKQLKLMSTKDDVTKLEKYIDFWNPMEFVTRVELENYSDKMKKELKKIVSEFLKKEEIKK